MAATIIGLGLIGGSIGKALVRRGERVTFLDPAVSLDEAVSARAADAKIDDFEAIPSDDLVVFATPVDMTRRLLARYRLANATTTVCSVMAPFSDLARVAGLHLTPGHPLAGTAQTGLAASDAALFEGKRWFVERGRGDAAVSRLVAMCGAEEIEVDAEEHDRSLAYTSHLPQLLSTALGAVIEAAGVDVETFGGSGLRTFLRLAASERSVWRPIFEANAEALELATTDAIERIEAMLTGEDSAAFEAANRVAARLASEMETRKG